MPVPSRAEDSQREVRGLFRSRGTQRGSRLPLLFRPRGAAGMDSDDMEWEELLLLDEEGVTRALTTSEAAEDGARTVLPSRLNDSNLTQLYAPPRDYHSREIPPTVVTTPLDIDRSLALFRDADDDGLMSLAAETYPCPDMWTIEVLLSRNAENEGDVEDVTQQRSMPEVRSRGMIGRQRRRSFDEEMRLNAMRHRLRRCLERSNATLEAVNGNTLTAHTTESEVDFPVPAFTSLLTPGMEFKGFQRCLRVEGTESSSNSIEDWAVHAQIRRYDVKSGYVCGTMAAFVKNNAPVETFWEGEIIDNQNFTFLTNKWSADASRDNSYWTKFAAYRELMGSASSEVWRSPLLKEYPYIFMRWKETYFMTKTEQNLLTIKGFYYICMVRQTGELCGYYYDPDCQPFQELALQPDTHGRPGFAFSNGQFL